ncbi:uncharacterized protein LOC123008992 [Tribolium madens]|uniref:uncharacterized protein LOC123008992 n=1 Tax=Tribolium madens TaxID=41895 RepID=UPI001CF72713|nr:uncharacterized protein LOC123008992 [Tribolium madens]
MQFLAFVAIVTFAHFVFSRPDLATVIKNACKPENDDFLAAKAAGAARKDRHLFLSSIGAYRACVHAMRMIMLKTIQARQSNQAKLYDIPLEVLINRNCFTKRTEKTFLDCLSYVGE